VPGVVSGAGDAVAHVEDTAVPNDASINRHRHWIASTGQHPMSQHGHQVQHTGDPIARRAQVSTRGGAELKKGGGNGPNRARRLAYTTPRAVTWICVSDLPYTPGSTPSAARLASGCVGNRSLSSWTPTCLAAANRAASGRSEAKSIASKKKGGKKIGPAPADAHRSTRAGQHRTRAGERGGGVCGWGWGATLVEVSYGGRESERE